MSADLVVFGEDWGEHPSSTQHLVQRLAVDRRVVWINSIGMRRPRLTARDLGRLVGKARNFAGRGRTPADPQPPGNAKPLPPGLTVHSVAAIPAPGSRLAYALNRRLLARQVRRLLDERRIARPVLWTSLPTALPAVGTLDETAVVYYCGDDFGALAGVDHAPVQDMERALVTSADLVLAASDVLATRFPAGKTLVVPHGADISLFATPAARAPELPADRPTAGFYGSLSTWIDVDLLAAVAARMPEWRFTFVGPVQTDVGRLVALPNVDLLGALPHARLPGFAQHWTVSLIPFRSCPQIDACNPLKLREYLAAGAPIATTDFPALGPYRDLVEIGSDAASFETAIRQAARDTARNAERSARVAGETWDRRAADVAAAIDAL
ncbi:MAG: glycosyltransferase [Hyphomicrobiaceae bacterium]